MLRLVQQHLPGEKQKRAKDDAVPHIIEFDTSPAAYRKRRTRLI